jgi:hypothetical protein
MVTQDLDRMRFITKNFGNLQGLRYLVPLGLVLLGWEAHPVYQAVLFLGAFLLMAAARRYYRSSFGEVERPQTAPPVSELAPLSIYNRLGPARSLPPVIPGVPRIMLLALLVLTVFPFFQFLFSPPWVQMNSGVVWTGFSATATVYFTRAIYFLCGSLLISLWWLRGCRLSWSHPFGLGALLWGLSVLGPWFLPAASQIWTALLLCGASMVVEGLLDHWQLVRMLGRSAAAAQGEP